MRIKWIALICGLCLLVAITPDVGFARGRHSHSSHSYSYHSSGGHYRSHSTYTSGHHRSTYAQGVQQDSHGRIARSEAARERFMRMTGHLHGWPGHVIDHIVPLKRGGRDEPSNMRWKTIEEAKAKDKVE